MDSVLVSWIGLADLRAATQAGSEGLGPVAQALDSRRFDCALLLSDFPQQRVAPYVEWLAGVAPTPVTAVSAPLSSPTNLEEIYRQVVAAISGFIGPQGSLPELTFHLSAGTPAMATIWILLGKSRYPSARLIESSREQGVKNVEVPFDIAAEFLPGMLRRYDQELTRRSGEHDQPGPSFAGIVHRSQVMANLLARARRVAPRSVPVLIEGETGTGKELLARAIHGAGLRRDRGFVAVNCGAIPRELVESELFGHEKGAFTGAANRRAGYIEAAHTGTLFLDEVGELPLDAQVKLLRFLQEGEVQRLGSTRPVAVDVRVIAATNRDLLAEVAANRFRSDLYYRLAVAILRVPPLRDREGDVSLLIDKLLDTITLEQQADPGFEPKRLSAPARSVLLRHPWPGNVRELQNVLRRATLWTTGNEIGGADARDAIGEHDTSTRVSPLEQPLGEGFNLPETLALVARTYLKKALSTTRGNKTEAARLLGLASYQTLTNWLRRYGVAE